MRGELFKLFPKAKWCEYEPIVCRNEVNVASPEAFSCVGWLNPDSRARVIVCLDADILGTHPAAVRYARDFAEGRKAGTRR